MEGPSIREGTFSPEAAYYIDKFARKEEECNEIVAQFNKYKVKTKVRFDQLRHEISNILHEKNVNEEDEQQHPAMLLISLNETQFKLEEAEKLSSSLRADVEKQQVHINDQLILIKNLEDQLREWEESEIARERRRNEPVDIERVQQQMMYKDERIVELNSVILDKERQILDLQDACRSASEVATSKKEAMRIVQKKFDEMEKRSRREASTETDDRVTGISFDGSSSSQTSSTPERTQRSMQQPSQPPTRSVRTSSPGRAVHVVNKNGCISPPPLDPAEMDDLPGTSKLVKTNVDGDSSNLRDKKQRKKVTFALPQAASREDISRLTADADSDEITEALVNLTAENERMRGEIERITRMEEEMEEMAIRVAQAESAVSEAEREARHASLKARAVAQARIKELEDRMATQNAAGATQIDRLQTETETLRSTRDWEVEQNARMREQLAHTKEKLRQLREELDASVLANRVADKKLEEKELLLSSLVSELEDAESLAVFLEDQKHQILDDVDQLKDIIKLHEEQINLLEADNLIYETRVGHLREELGVSKINQRDHIKSKAFNTKLQMINKEKEQIDRKANDERLRTKALHAKVQILEAENERLMAKLCEVEMGHEDTSILDAACKELQARMEQAEAESTRVRAEFDARIRASEFATDSLREECDRLRSSLDSSDQTNSFLQQQLMQAQHNHHEQTRVNMQMQQQHGQSKQHQMRHEDDQKMEEGLRLAQRTQETLTMERDELAERVHVLGGENFELTRRTDEAEREVQRLESELSRLSSRLRSSSESMAAADADRQRREERTVEREEELIDLRARVAERDTTVERIETELKRLRAELDHAHLSMAETSAVKKEVANLHHQLEIEREAAAAKWQQVMVQLKSYEELASNSGWDSRKTSIDETAHVAAAAELRASRAEAEAKEAREELQRVLMEKAEQHPHQLQDVQPVQHEVPRRAVSSEDEEESEDAHEIDRLRARVEELESEVELSHELNVESGRTVQALQHRLEKAEHEKRLLESLTVEFSEDIADMKEAAAVPTAVVNEGLQEASDDETNEMRKKIEDMEEEATLSAELHVEMGRTVKALEGKIKEMEMERRLHEMMSVELTTELHELRQLQQDHLQNAAATNANVDSDSTAAEIAVVNATETAAAAAEQEAQLQQQLEEEKRQRAREQQAARDELHRLQLALHAAEDAKREVARQLAEREQTESLVRATAATFDAVSVAVGVSGVTEEAEQQQASEIVGEEEERVILVQENVLLREAVYQNVRHQESVTSDVARLLELKEELEKAVEALRGEIWSLNGQLKASAFDRENLQDRVVELDTKVALEKRRADLLDVELAEQVELRENAQRQAAEAENESNRRLAECAEMDGKREDLEKAYALLAGYYSQLQEAYNVLYTQQHQQQEQLQQERMQMTATSSGETLPREDRSTQTDIAPEPSTSTASVTAPHPPSSSSSRRAMAEAYASRLSALRELSVQLTKSVLATELATLESQLDNSITSIEGLSSDCPEAGASVDALLDAIIQDHDESSSSVSPDARAKIASVHAMLRAKISEVERVHSALREQRGVCTALEERLTEWENAGPSHGIGALLSPGGASSSAPSELEERIEECEALKAHVEQLQEIISRYVSREEAARLATREADVDSLFRANAELAHENVRLQNELDEEKEEETNEEKEKEKVETASSSTQTHDQADFDEAELELIREELEAEQAKRREVERRIEIIEMEKHEQQEQLEETIVDLTMQLQGRGQRGEGGMTEEEREELSLAAASAGEEAAALRADLEKEKNTRKEAEKELDRRREEIEDMRTEMQLKEANGDEMKQKMEQQKTAKIVAEKELERAKEEIEDMITELQMKEADADEESSASSHELAQLRSQLQQEQTGRIAAEEKLAIVEMERRKMDEEMNRLKKEVKKEEVQKEKKEDDGWGEEGWGNDEDEEKEKEVKQQPLEQASVSNDELAELRDKLEWERAAREEAEKELEDIEKEKKRIEEELKNAEKEREITRRKLIDAEEREEKLKKELLAKKEEKKEEQVTKEDDGWGNDGWGEEEEQKEFAPLDQSAELAELKARLQEEINARMALQLELKEKEEEGAGWGEESSSSSAALSTLQHELQKEKKERERLEKELMDAEELETQLREEIQVLEEENKRMEAKGGEEKEEDDASSHCSRALHHRDEMTEMEADFARLKAIYVGRMEEMETQNANDRDTMIKYERIMSDRAAKISWLEEKIVSIESGQTITDQREESEDEEDERDPSSILHDGWLGEQRHPFREVYNTIENPEEEVVEEEEVQYKRNRYVPEDPDEVTALCNALTDFIDEAADLQDESRSGDATAHHNERIRLRHIVHGMTQKLQDLEDEYFNEGGHIKEFYGQAKKALRLSRLELEQTKVQLASALEAVGEAGTVRDVKIAEDNEEMEKLKKQNHLLQESERKLTECLDTANDRLDEMGRHMESVRQQLASTPVVDESAVARQTELQQRVMALEATIDAKESQLTIALRDAAATLEAKNALEQRLERITENAKRRKAAALAAASPSLSLIAPTRSYVEGSRRTSAASSVWNEEIREEPEQPQPVRVDQAQLEQQVLLEVYRASLCDLLERVSDYLTEAESRDRSTAVTIDCLQLNIDHVNQQLEMGKKQRGKRTSVSTASDAVTTADTHTDGATNSELSPSAHSNVSSSEVKLAEEEMEHSIISRLESAHTVSTQDVRETVVERLQATEEKTQTEGENEEQIGEIIQQELHATRTDLLSLRDGLASFVSDMGEWMKKVEIEKKEKEDEKTEMIDYLQSELIQLNASFERVQMEKDVIESELDQANQAIWHLQQTAKAATTAAHKAEEEASDAHSRMEKEHTRIREHANELERMMGEADRRIEEMTEELKEAGEEMKMMKKERDEIEKELSRVLEESEGRIEGLEEELKRTKEERDREKNTCAVLETELRREKEKISRQSESLQKSVERECRIEQLLQQIDQMATERVEREEELKKIRETLNEVSAEMEMEKERAAETKRELEQEKLQHADVEGAMTAATVQLQTLQQVQQQLQLALSDKDAAAAQHEKIASEMEKKLQQSRVDMEETAAAAKQLKQTMQDVEKQLQQAQLDQTTLIVADETNKQLEIRIEGLEKQLQQTCSEQEEAANEHEKTIEEMKKQLQQYLMDVEEARAALTNVEKRVEEAQLERASHAEENNSQQAKRIEELEEQLHLDLLDKEAVATQHEKTVGEMEKQLQQAQLDQAAVVAAEEMNKQLEGRIERLEEQLQHTRTEQEVAGSEHEKMIEEMKKQLQQYLMDMEAAKAAVTAAEKKVEEAQLEKASNAAENSSQQAKRIEELEEQLRHSLQSAQDGGRANGDLEEDIARMEMELARALAKIERTEESMAEANERADSFEAAAVAARQEVAILASQLDRVSFDVQQSQQLQESSDDGMEREMIERIKELEKEAEKRDDELGQMLDDLRSADERVEEATAIAATATERALTMENTVAELRTRLDEALGEAESLRRSVREVQNLEAALLQAHVEQSQLAAAATVAREERRVMVEEKETALAELASIRDQLSQRTTQAIRASEERNRSMDRMIQMEQQMQMAQHGQVANEGEAAAVMVQVEQIQTARQPSPPALVQIDMEEDDATVATAGAVDVTIVMPEMSLDDEGGEGEEEEDSSMMDELLPRSGLVFASSPSPHLLDQLKQWLRRQARYSRSLRGNRALMPYVRYAGAVYVIFLQLAVIHCWFF